MQSLDKQTCRTCGGDGKVPVVKDGVTRMAKCPSCRGAGTGKGYGTK